MSTNRKLMRSELLGDAECRHEKGLNLADQPEEKEKKHSLLLHSCCGPCSTSVVEQLASEFDITIFYFNPNITDEEEYRRRKDTQMNFVNQYNLSRNRVSLLHFTEGRYEPEEFFRAVIGHEGDSEGGNRCRICFRLRMEETAYEASIKGFDCFGTTLTVSPHKNYDTISQIGNRLSVKCRLQFLDRDFKKRNGYGRSVELSREYGLYRQKYCGCEFSK